MNRKPKTIYKLDTPFSEVLWPQIKSEDHETILELLINLLSPIGSHRSTHIVPSNGKRSKKRKRELANTNSNEIIQPPVPTPELSSYLLVGLASITRHLESLSRASQAKAFGKRVEEEQSKGSTAKSPVEEEPSAPHLAAVFVSHASQSSVLNTHLPQLIVTASLAHPHSLPTRLVQLPKSSDERVAASLGLPRALFIAIIEDAPHSKPLLEYLDKHVPPVDISWLQQIGKMDYKPVRVSAIETTVPVIKKGLKADS